ncbi:MAG: hypothetical protein KDB00_22865, partial [Planctomycetales bacterium]|nr:hypothetical protein [Planctomycetales bacterium]
MASPISPSAPMNSQTGQSRPVLPADRRVKQGGWLFLISLLVFFVCSILLYGLYAYPRRDDPLSLVPLPKSFLVSTVCLIAISFLVHAATRQVRRDRFRATAWLLGISTAAAVIFTVVQCLSM